MKPGLPRVELRKRLERAVAGGHPWLYRDALAKAPPLPDGTIVRVTSRTGRALAIGFWDAQSPIAVRVIGGADGTGAPDMRAVVGERIAAALARRLAILDRAETDAFRWLHGEGDRLPGVHVDLYGTAASLRYDGDGARAFYRACDLPGQLVAAAATAGVKVDTIVERRRARGDGATRAEERSTVVGGAAPPPEIEIRENGLRFGVDLMHGQKGGLFLDQRDNRARVGTLARGRRVLNLFGYTGGFSVYAAAGGARATVTVDAAAPAIAAARHNFERNRLAIDDARFIVGDAFEFLARAGRERDRFDLVISDPPSFVPSRRALPAGLRAYRRLHRLCAAVTAPGGTFCAASCSSHVDRVTFLATLREAARDAGRSLELREVSGAGPDHPVLSQFPEGDYLKFAVVQL